MAAIKKIDGFFVKVRPLIEFGVLTPNRDKQKCEDLRLEILGECDAYDATVETVSHFECEFCGDVWPDEKQWQCCDASIEELMEQKNKF